MAIVKLLDKLLCEKKIKELDISKAHGKIQDLLKESINDSVSNLVHK